jgi:hypothetical protein
VPLQLEPATVVEDDNLEYFGKKVKGIGLQDDSQ